VGVSTFENPSFNLEFADNDAREMQSAIAEDLTVTGQFSEIVPISLTSDYKKQGARSGSMENLATKENFRKVLARLNNRDQQATAPKQPAVVEAPAPATNATKPARRGKRPPKAGSVPNQKAKEATVAQPSIESRITNFDKLRPATPDDMVLILYSSHGYADRAGNFYLIPYDTGAGTEKVFTETVQQHSISSEELSSWLRDVDAGELVLIVDACHSTAAVEGRGFKPGPMGSRGLGQLSYDKGMRILTATQADNVALENKTVRQGLLTYALTRDGLHSRYADFKPQDKTITLLEWLEYGEARVPKLNEEIRSGIISSALAQGGDQPRFVSQDNARGLVDTGPATPAAGSPPTDGSANNAQANAVRLQQPALFDFARGSRDTVMARSPK
jgi:hypothetical protein